MQKASDVARSRVAVVDYQFTTHFVFLRRAVATVFPEMFECQLKFELVFVPTYLLELLSEPFPCYSFD